jgi:PAS domain S-box-containing protein
MTQAASVPAQDALRAQVMRAVRATLDAMSAHVALIDEAGEIVAVNAAWRSFAEREGAGSDLVGSNYLEVCDDAPQLAAREAAEGVREVLAGVRGEFELEYSCHAPHERRWFQMRVIRCTPELGLGAIIAHADITARAVADERLRMQAALLDEVDAAVVVADLHYAVEIWSDGAERLYGWTREEAVGRDLRELFADEPGLADRAERSLRAEGRWEGEFRARRRDGSMFPAFGRQRLMLDADGVPAAVVGISLDVSERVRAREDLENARNYLQAVTDSMGEGVFTLDPDGCLVYVNPAAHELLGWSLAEMAGRPMHAMMSARGGDDEQPPPPGCPICREGVLVREPDGVFTRSDGVELPVGYTAAPITGEHGIVGCVVVFEDITRRKAEIDRVQRDLRRLSWLRRVQEALDDGRFILHAQPIADARTGEVVQRELLLRMLGPGGSADAPELIAPGEYLPVAEQYGLITEVDRWVIDRAAEIAGRGLSVQCNVSARSISDPAFVDHVRDAIERNHASASRLVFEITETAIVSHEPSAHEFVERLHALGCRIALDDFGTGYGAFSYLKKLPIDYLKIDIEFVRDALVDPSSRSVVTAIVRLARDFGLKTVAEGVENGPTLALMRQLGVDYVQGFHVGRPAPLVTGDFGN